MSKNYNLPFIAGIVSFLFLFLISVCGPWVVANFLTEKMEVGSILVDGEYVLRSPPLSPFEYKDHLLGTDRWGHDILSKMLNGARYTFFVSLAIAGLRTLLGGLAGLYLGMRSSVPAWWLAIEDASSYLPAFLVVYFILLPLSMNSPLTIGYLVILLILLVTGLGIPPAASSIRKKTNEIKKMAFIEASKSLGARKSRILFKHIIPQLRNPIVVLFLTEVVAVLTLLGILGLFNLFVGGTEVQYDEDVIFLSITNDWAGLSGQARSNLQYNRWILFIPLTGMLFMISSFSLLAKGWKQRIESGYKRAPWI